MGSRYHRGTERSKYAFFSTGQFQRGLAQAGASSDELTQLRRSWLGAVSMHSGKP
ncbi:MAG TPA: hypothetical protein VF881_09105 [Polyangiaceae bacterium]